MKVCSKCGVDKNLDCFPIRKDRKSGVRGTCIECFNADRRNRCKDNKDKIREQNKKQYEKNRENRIEWQKEYQNNLTEDQKEIRRQRVREWYLKNRDKQKEQRKEQKERIDFWQKEYYKKRDRKKLNANQRVSDALLKGTLIRPKECSICGSDKYKIQGHHEDYSKPLEITWVCTFCHSAIHKELKKRSTNAS